MTELDETALVIKADSRLWRRRLGPLAWAALEHLALAAHPDHHGWAAPLGVRDVAGGIGVTKDTAAPPSPPCAPPAWLAWSNSTGSTGAVAAATGSTCPKASYFRPVLTTRTAPARGTTARTGGTIETALGVQLIGTSQHLPMEMAPPIRPNELAVDAVTWPVCSSANQPVHYSRRSSTTGRFIHLCRSPDQLLTREDFPC